MNEWAWVLVTDDGVTTYPNQGPHEAYVAVGVDIESDDTAGIRSFALMFRQL